MRCTCACTRGRASYSVHMCACLGAIPEWTSHDIVSAFSLKRNKRVARPVDVSPAGTRTRVFRVRAEYPNQLDYRGAVGSSQVAFINKPLSLRLPLGLATCTHTLKRPCGSESAFSILAACATRPPGTRERERARDRGTSTCTFACACESDRRHESQFWQPLQPPACVGNASARDRRAAASPRAFSARLDSADGHHHIARLGRRG